MRAVAYLRVSTDEQAESGAGLQAQLDACRSYSERENIELAGPLSDEGISGAAPLDKRPGLLEALALVGRGDVLLVAKRDRLGRDPIVVALIEAAVKRQAGRVVSTAGEGTDSDDPTNVLMRRIVDAFAEYERLVIKARTRAALAAKCRRGQRTGRVPLGYDLVDDGTRSKKGLMVGLAPNPVELATVRLIRQLRGEGVSLRKIATELDRRGIRPKQQGERWSHTAVVRVLERTEPRSEHSEASRRPS